MDWSSIFRGMKTSGSGMSSERTRLDVIAQNIANARVTQGPNGLPYRRQEVLFETIMEDLKNGEPGGVQVTRVVEDTSPFVSVHLPNHPHADEKGFVKMPNVNIAFEMTDMITAIRAYEANLAAAGIMKQMVERTLGLGR